MEHLETGVLIWWISLSAATALNVALLVVVARAATWEKASPDERMLVRRLLILAAIYVAVCGFRSVVPRADVRRFVLWDSWISSVFLGRSVATVAELAFIIQWALVIDDLARRLGDRIAARLARALVPIIVVAEGFSWYAVLTTNSLGNGVEESLWGVSGALLTIAALLLRRRAAGPLRSWLSACAVGTAGYVAYMALVDVPTYLSRWSAGEAAGRSYLGLSEGLTDALFRRVVTGRWIDWRYDVLWMSLYFSFAVWVSIGLALVPRLARRSAP